MSLRALRTLVAIARHGSFARAAEAVHLTQSAVSLHVKALEDEFKAQLFDRSRRQTALTDAGRLAVDRAMEILALYDAISGEIGAGSELRGRLRIGAIPTVLTNVMPAVLASLTESHPHLSLTVACGMSAELATRLESGELDVAITTDPVKPHPYGLVSTALYQEHFWLLAPGHLRQVPYKQLLADHPFIRFDRRAWAGRTIDRELRRMRLRVRTTMELDSREAIIKMVANGLGVAVVPLSGQDSLADLVIHPFGEPQCSRWVVLLEREDRPGGRLTEALAAAVRGARDHIGHEK